jgi:phytoene dehydrogenase-like protein
VLTEPGAGIHREEMSMNKTKKVLIIGAGVAGLSAASYLRRNGFDTEIFELHSIPGGLCTSWKCGDYTFDDCIHWLAGSGPSSNMHEIWKELGAGDLHYVEWDVWTVIHLPDGDSFTVYTDPDRLEAEMLRLGPEDSAAVRMVTKDIRSWQQLDGPVAPEKMPVSRRIAFLARTPTLVSLMKWSKLPDTSFFAQFKSAKLREAIEILHSDYVPEGYSPGAISMILGLMAKRSAGYPIGGSLALAKAIESRYLALGGKIHYGFKVDKIIVESDKAVGIRGTKGEVRGDYVISAADGYDTVKRLLGGRYPHPDLEASFAEEPSGLRRSSSAVAVCLGLARDCSELPHLQTFPLEEPLVFEAGALSLTRLSIRQLSFDPTMAPPGKTAAIINLWTRNDSYWTRLKERDPVAYAAEKQATAEKVIAALDRFIPGLKGCVETVDVATPSTFIRYTNNWRGSCLGWAYAAGISPRKTIDGLDNFYMVGQWVNPGGGLPTCGKDGRNLAKMLCKREGQRFKPD